MAEWSMGYQTDLQYTFGYFRMNNPLYARYLFTSQGLAFPRMGGARLMHVNWDLGRAFPSPCTLPLQMPTGMEMTSTLLR